MTVVAGETEFEHLVAPYRDELHRHCYRMLGSVADADDALQTTLIAAWRGHDAFEGRSSERTWLYRIATNTCLNVIRADARRPRPVPIAPFTPPTPTSFDDVVWLGPYPDARLPEHCAEARETIELAFVEALQRMPPRQAAALILRDVLDFPTPEVADLLGTTPTAVKGMLARARAARPAAAVRTAGEHDLARRFAEAFVTDDVDAVVALLTDDAWLAMPPAPHRYRGPAAVARFLRASAAARTGPLTLTPTRMNTQPAFALAHDGRDFGVLVLTVDGDRLAGLTRFLPAGEGQRG